MYLSRGQRIKLSEICNSKNFVIKILTENSISTKYDVSCFGLDENNKCSDDKYLIFYNQNKSPCNSIILLNSVASNLESFEINISKLPSKIKKLVFTMTIDGEGTMSQLKQGSILLFENGNLKGGYKFIGSDFDLEKSIVVGEIYFKNEWRFTATGHGFNGGMSSLLEHFGIEEDKNESILSVETSVIEKNKFSSFIKSVLTAPFKYNENKLREKNELNEIKAREISEYNRRIDEEQRELNEKNNNEKKFKELLIEYLSDGVLTEDEMKSLDKFCKQNNLYLHQCLSQSMFEIENFLHVMLADIVLDNIVTSEKEATINSVLHFLHPSERIKNEIDETIKRVKLIEKIKSGNIVAITIPEIVTKASELSWYHQKNVSLVKHLKNNRRLYEGKITVTSERIIFTSHEQPMEIPLKNILSIEVDGCNFYIVSKKLTSLFQLDESEILESYVDQSLKKFHRKLDFKQTTGNTRTIPQTVKHHVWIRDRGQCMQCTATQYLEYDHIIPFSKGGSNSEKNIQLLCRGCNLKKSDII